uniref:Uncharacterized protein n=1 Tax=Maylandia zebra TaxID=106582 RepID=A0A3P9CB49_9CICH
MPVYESVSVWRVLPVLFCRSVSFVSAFSFVLSLSRQCNQRQPCLPHLLWLHPRRLVQRLLWLHPVQPLHPHNPRLVQPLHPRLVQPLHPRLVQPLHPRLVQPLHPRLVQPLHPRLVQPLHPRLVQPLHPRLVQPPLPPRLVACAWSSLPVCPSVFCLCLACASCLIL